MLARTFLLNATGLMLAALMLGITPPAALGQTPLPSGFEIRLLPGYEHVPLRGIDSIVGKFVKKDNLQIQYEMGAIPKGGLVFGGSYFSQALRVPEKDRQWLKEQDAGGRKVQIAYTKDNRLIVSSASTTEGVNFHVIAKTQGDVADVLLMVLTFTEKKVK